MCFFTSSYVMHDMFVVQKYDKIGISIDRSIFLPGGRLGLDWHMEWLKTRELIEEEERSKQEHENTNLFGPSSIIVNKNDVLFGRGKNTREHTGNLRCAYLVEVREEEYNACRKAAKTKIAEQVVSMVLDSGGRFLKKDTKVKLCESIGTYNIQSVFFNFTKAVFLFLFYYWRDGMK